MKVKIIKLHPTLNNIYSIDEVLEFFTKQEDMPAPPNYAVKQHDGSIKVIEGKPYTKSTSIVRKNNGMEYLATDLTRCWSNRCAFPDVFIKIET